MRKSGRPSNATKKLKDGFYMSISNANTSKSVRIMRETFEQMKLVETQYKDRNFKYLGQIKDNFWIDGENKGKATT
tara:strand:+ start:211 stop:438 length:228 start_codon:yes stop_codon:yes gene_type:complete